MLESHRLCDDLPTSWTLDSGTRGRNYWRSTITITSRIAWEVVVTELSLDGSQLHSDLVKFRLLPGEPFLEFKELLLDIWAWNTRVSHLQLHLQPQSSRRIQEVSLSTSSVGNTTHPPESYLVQVLPGFLEADVVETLESEHLKLYPDHPPVGVGEEETDEVFI